MSIAAIAPTDDIYGERWRLWQVAYAHSSRQTHTRARLVFAVTFIILAVWLGLQLLSAQPWP